MHEFLRPSLQPAPRALWRRRFFSRLGGSEQALACILASHRLFAFREDRTLVKLKSTIKARQMARFSGLSQGIAAFIVPAGFFHAHSYDSYIDLEEIDPAQR